MASIILELNYQKNVMDLEPSSIQELSVTKDSLN